MKKIKILILLTFSLLIYSCDDVLSDGSYDDRQKTMDVGNKMSRNQATPVDIEYSLERYNLIKRAYWVNGQREKALSLPSPVKRPLGYVTLFTENGGIVGSFVVDGKVSSLNSYLTPDSEKYAGGSYSVEWLPDVDGTYGKNDSGIFFFTPDGKYIEWNGKYVYSDIPMEVKNTVVDFKDNSKVNKEVKQ
mgnify:FL=1